MSKKFSRKCIACGKEYEYCPRCGEYAHLPRWMVNFESEKCHDVFEAIRDYNFGNIKKEDVQAVIDKHHIKDFSQFNDDIKKELERILKKDSARVLKKAE